MTATARAVTVRPSRIRVVADDGWIALDEHVCAEQLASEHYRRCLADRIRWAVEDAERRASGDPVLAAVEPPAEATPLIAA